MKVINRISWGKISKSIDTRLFELDESKILGELTKKSKGIPIGTGKSYGDAGISNLGDYWSAENQNFIEIDHHRKIAKCGAGASIRELELVAMASGYFPFVVPGTALVTIGGCIASDVHGKSHHLHGSFGSHVASIELLRSDGVILTLSPKGKYSDLFWATVGGMGLTGLIVSAEIELMDLKDPMIKTEEARFRSYSQMVTLMNEFDTRFAFTVGWIDIRKNGKFRGIVTGGNLNNSQISLPKKFPQKFQKLKIPNLRTSFFVNNIFIRIFNSFWYLRPLNNKVSNILNFMHPLDGLQNWNNIYGRNGFYQFQCLIPENAEHKLLEILQYLSKNGIHSFMTVIKKLGKPSHGLLSFPDIGWTLAVDIPNRKNKTIEIILQLNLMTAEAGGKVYLAKDSLLNESLFRTMYPKSSEFKNIKSIYDTSNYWMSDLSARLGLN